MLKKDLQKKYSVGMVLGRFQPLHNGHIALIDKALSMCKQVVVFIGSAQEKNFTATNPFHWKVRAKWIKKYYKKQYREKRLIITPVIDLGVGNNPIWGEYLCNMCYVLTDHYPEAYFTGTETDRDNWLTGTIAKTVTIESLDRNDIKISGTLVRRLLFDNPNNNKDWKDLVPKVVAKDLINI